MKTQKVLFCGITRNNAKRIPTILQYIDTVGALFQDYRAIIYENDSSDGTDVILKDWKDKNPTKVVLISEQLNVPEAISTGGFSLGRFQRLALCREKYRQEMLKPEYDDYSHVIVIDMDLESWDIHGIAHTFGLNINDWDYVSANGKLGMLYYDTLAFRNQQYTDTLNNEAQRNQAQLKNIRNKFAKLMPVYSSFGGLSIYKKQLFDRAGYVGSGEKGLQEVNDCEHVIFHQKLRDLGYKRFFMNPAMIVQY